MKTKILTFLAGTIAIGAYGARIDSPSGTLSVEVDTEDGRPVYSVLSGSDTVLSRSPLGLHAKHLDLSEGFSLKQGESSAVHKNYNQDRIKKSHIDWRATRSVSHFSGADGKSLDVEWLVGDNDIAFRYLIPKHGETGSTIVEEELTGYRFPAGTTMFVSSQSDAMIGWKRTKPSYEEYYLNDVPTDTRSEYGHGFTWPALFRLGEDGWVLLGESGVDGYYCASHLSDSKDGVFSVSYPLPEENNGNGNAAPGIALPGATPWRTITFGKDLSPIVETTIPWNVTEPLYRTSEAARPGKGTWSWILWQDNSINYDDQKTFIDFAADMGYQNVLIDCGWDVVIGRERMPELIAYAHSKNVEPILWYSSSGHWNDIVQSPINCMDRPIVRKKEMKWLRDNGVRAIKVDFFGGDKQETMRLYEDILSDAADHGIDVIFHGCTLPRGWERMYPNFVGAEAVLASENLVFQQDFCDKEAYHATLHPFIRNSLAIMEYGGSTLNRHFSRDNKSGNIRRTGDGFQLATSVLFQNPVQNFALAPNIFADAPAEAVEFMKEVPTTWTDTRYIAGYPGRYVILQRESGDKVYTAGVNATSEVVDFDLKTLGLTGEATLYIDTDKGLRKSTIKADKKNKIKIPSEGGFVLVAARH